MAQDVLEVSEEVHGHPVDRAGALTWLRDVSVQLAVTHALSHDGEGRSQLEVHDTRTTPPDAAAGLREMSTMIRQLVAHLPDDSRILIQRCYFEGRQMNEVAAELKVSKGWVSRLHARTLRRLAHALRRLGIDSET
jgi:RNA polymerase sigma factor (sigma-70 family)